MSLLAYMPKTATRSCFLASFFARFLASFFPFFFPFFIFLLNFLLPGEQQQNKSPNILAVPALLSHRVTPPLPLPDLRCEQATRAPQFPRQRRCVTHTQLLPWLLVPLRSPSSSPLHARCCAFAAHRRHVLDSMLGHSKVCVLGGVHNDFNLESGVWTSLRALK